jgi:hypothetical protein
MDDIVALTVGAAARAFAHEQADQLCPSIPE